MCTFHLTSPKDSRVKDHQLMHGNMLDIGFKGARLSVITCRLADVKHMSNLSGCA